MTDLLIRLGINLGLFALEKYSKTTESKTDDKVLEILKVGSTYLAPKPNNTLSVGNASAVNDSKIIHCQKSKD